MKNEIVIINKEYEIYKELPLIKEGVIVDNADTMIYSHITNSRNKSYNSKLVNNLQITPIDLQNIFHESYLNKLKNKIIKNSIEDILLNLNFYKKKYVNNSNIQVKANNIILPNKIYINPSKTIGGPNNSIDNKLSTINDKLKKINVSVSFINDDIIFNKSKIKINSKNIEDKKYYQLQLFISSSKDQVIAYYDDLYHKNKQLLKGHSYELTKKITPDNKIIYYLMFGKFYNFDEAKKICNKLLSQKYKCLVI